MTFPSGSSSPPLYWKPLIKDNGGLDLCLYFLTKYSSSTMALRSVQPKVGDDARFFHNIYLQPHCEFGLPEPLVPLRRRSFFAFYSLAAFCHPSADLGSVILWLEHRVWDHTRF